MSSRWRGAAALIVCAALIGGCSSKSPADQGPKNAQDKAAQDQKIQASGGPPATQKDKFMPVLQSEYGKVKWPKKYVMTTDKLWQKMGGDHNTTLLSKSDAVTMVGVWNICAWSLQLIDDTKASKSTGGDVAALKTFQGGDLQDTVKPILEEAPLGGLSSVNAFVDANDCRKGFA